MIRQITQNMICEICKGRHVHERHFIINIVLVFRKIKIEKIAVNMF